MAKVTKNVVDSTLRTIIFDDLFSNENLANDYNKINDRQYGVILTDLNGHERYVRIGAIVAEEREDVSARELMAKEIQDYNEKQTIKAEKAAKRAEKAEADRLRREEKEKEKGE